MQQKTKRIESVELLNIKFKKAAFVNYTIISIVFIAISLYLIELIPVLGIFKLFLIFIYFLPTGVAFDIFSDYDKEYNVPKLKHPNRIFITLVNLILGWTILGWLISLKMALTPGQVEVRKIDFI
jgi:hypothetical protein